MVGNTMFNVEINNRLKDIKGSSLPFRGVSIIAIGDLFQLQPVTDGYVFKRYEQLSLWYSCSQFVARTFQYV